MTGNLNYDSVEYALKEVMKDHDYDSHKELLEEDGYDELVDLFVYNYNQRESI